jgi:DNA-binding CsgD family transcriptional regulator
MNLTHRPTRFEDFEDCYRLIHNRFVFEKTKTKEDLRALWRQVFDEGIAVSAVVEDRDRPEGKRVVAHGLTLFVTEDFAHQTATNLPAYPVLQILRFWKRGKRPFLTPREIARANTEGGLQAMGLFAGWEKDNAQNEKKRHQKLEQGFFEVHAGWRLKGFQMEGYGAWEKNIMKVNGYPLIRDYKEGQIVPKPLKGLRPFLMGIYKKDSDRWGPQYHVARTFNYTPPRFHFSAGEKEMLARALEDETDLEISRSLGLSPWTVKKRWQAVYAKVERTDPGLLRHHRHRSPKPGEAQQAQRRRGLLDYLRQHWEEIRPTLPQDRRSPIPRPGG